MKRHVFYVLLILIIPHISSADTLFTNSSLGYTAYLPDNWMVIERSDSQDIFFDTTNTYRSYISFIRHNRNELDFPLPEDWTRAHFIAYQICVEYSFDPWGAILYYDSSSTCRQGDLWAPETYAEFFSLDSVWGSWSEYVRFTANDAYGYELYAVGDTLDMINNIGLYAGLLQCVDIEGDTHNLNDIAFYRNKFSIFKNEAPKCLYDPIGRRMNVNLLNRKSSPSSGIYLFKNIKMLSKLH